MVIAKDIPDGLLLQMNRRMQPDHLLDQFEFHKLTNLYKEIGKKRPFPGQAPENINDIISRLIFPWSTSEGTMVGYEADPAIDDYFLRAVMPAIDDWRNDAGIHPSARIGDVTGADIATIAVLLASFRVKHMKFVDVGNQLITDVNTAMSLSIWRTAQQMQESVTTACPIDPGSAARALRLLTAVPEDAQLYQQNPTPYVPLLIEIADDYLLAPVSSVFRNPLHGFRTIQERLDQRAATAFRTPREEWMRTELVHLFQGTRYRTIDRSVELRRNGRLLTDIDAAIFDVTTGELALFQLKWQDFDSSDITKRRSKAKNFVDQVEQWGDRVTSWVESSGTNELMSVLRLKRHPPVSAIRLFAVGRSASRFRIYGYATTVQNLAVCSWPQLIRLRYEVGPIRYVLSEIQQRIQQESLEPSFLTPVQHDIVVQSRRIVFLDFWYADE
jgi:hypothetical protein